MQSTFSNRFNGTDVPRHEEFGAAMAVYYKAALCHGEARLSGLAFRAACRFTEAIGAIGTESREATQANAPAIVRAAAFECLYWLCLADTAGRIVCHEARESAMCAIRHLLEGIDPM